ncbi:MAG: choice-of-anchor J domain-containing protein [Opitutales bacterium]|nr:choice-of-anchor J domain-containing protein [Opitutales bacterium]
MKLIKEINNLLRGTPSAALALTASAFAVALPAASAQEDPFVRISEIRIMQPGFDADEYFELEGTPGYSLDGYWYLVLGDHSNFGNPDPNPPNFLSGVVEFAMDLTGYEIPESGFFLVVPTTFTLLPLSEVMSGGGAVIANLEFENNDNVTHILVRGYQGPEVLVMADQYGNLAVDLDPNNDGTLIDPLPWDETIDAIGLKQVLNSQVDVNAGDEFAYGEALGFENIGPDRGTFVPAHVFRGSNDGRWNIGIYSLDGGTDTPGGPNLPSPTEPIIDSFSPRTVLPQGSFTVTGRNFTNTESVLVGGTSVEFEIIDDETLVVTLPMGSSGGILRITNAFDTVETSAAVRVLDGNRAFVFYEDFETDLGDFLVVALSSNFVWRHRRFGGNGFAEMSGFRADDASDDWLISPEIDIPATGNTVLEFDTARNFSGPVMEVLLSTDWTGGSPLAATWTPLEGELSTGDFEITPSGQISLNEWAGQSVRIAFRYTSEGPDSGQGATQQLHDFLITNTAIFEAGWVDHPELGELFLLSPDWAFHPMVGFVHIRAYPWIFLPELDWLYHIGDHPDIGAWFFSVLFNDHIWSRSNLDGLFYFSDGATGSFFE